MPFLSAAYTFTFTVSSTASLNSNAVTVLLNGLDVSSELVLAGNSNVINVSLPGIAPNAIYTLAITASNITGSTSTNVTFDTFSQSDFTIEAEDFDFSSGQFIDNSQLTSTVAADSYYGKVGTVNIDENYVTYAGSHLFRASDDIATEITSDYLRQAYFMAQQTNSAVADYDVGWCTRGRG